MTMDPQERAAFVAYLTAKKKYTPEEAEMMAQEAEHDAPGTPAAVSYSPGPFEPLRQTWNAAKTIIPFVTAGAGSVIGRASPAIAERAGMTRLGQILSRIPGPLRAAVGAGAGDAGGAMATGTPPGEALRRGLFTGGVGLVAEAVPNVLARVGGAASGVPEESVNAALGAQRAPGSTGLKAALTRSGPATSARLTRFPLSLRGAPPAAAEDTLIQKFRREVNARPPGMDEAEAAMRAHKGPVSAFPVRQAISKQMRLRTQEDVPTPADATASESLGKMRELLPRKAVRPGMRPQQPGTGDFKDLTKLQNYLRRLRRPIAEKFGEPTPRLTAQDLKAIQQDVRAYRDRMLGGPASPGAKAFAKVHERLDVTEQLQDILEESSGEQRLSAEGHFRNAPTNQELMRRLSAVNPELAREVEELYHQRNWSKTPTGWHRFGVIGRAPARTAALLARPAGTGAAMITSYAQAREAQRRAADPMANP